MSLLLLLSRTQEHESHAVALFEDQDMTCRIEMPIAGLWKAKAWVALVTLAYWRVSEGIGMLFESSLTAKCSFELHALEDVARGNEVLP